MQPRVKKRKYEYRLRIYPDFHAESQRACVRFHFKTVEEFHHFNYRIDWRRAITFGNNTFQLEE